MADFHLQARIIGEQAARRAVRFAVRRLHEIERRSEILAAIGRPDDAAQLAELAAEIRAGVLS